MGIVIGGDSAWKVRRKGDVCIAYHWIAGEPAIVLYLYPRFAALSTAKTVPYVLPLASAHELVSERDNVNSRALLAKCSKAAELMGRAGDFATIKQLADILLDGLDDLIRMPPEPAHLECKQTPVGEAKLMVDGKTVAEGVA